MKLYLHVGHGKTGSSAIQTFLARNSSTLAVHGLEYPEHSSFANARQGKISSGNLSATEDWHERVRNFCINKSEGNILFSNENLFNLLSRDISPLKRLSNEFDVNVIIFVRDPLGHIFSSYGQAVKRGGEVASIDEFAKKWNVPMRVRKFLRNLCEENVTFTARNYSKSENIELDFCKILFGDRGLEVYSKCDHSNGIVNRSLSRVELELQRQFNEFYGSTSSSFISDALVNNLPQIEAEKEIMNAETVEFLKERLGPVVAGINALIPEREHLAFDHIGDVHAKNTEQFLISKDQIREFARSLSRRLLQAEARD